jgi:hypothetical protein
MIVNVKHAFTSPKADKGDASLIRPSNWNADHIVTLTGNPLNIYDLTGAPADVNLIPGDTAFHTFSAVTSLALRIALSEGIYEIDLIPDFDNTIGTAGNNFLLPNNASVTAGVIDTGYIYQGFTTTGDNTTAPVGGGNGTAHTAFYLGYNICRLQSRISTFTKSKNQIGDILRRESTTQFYQFRIASNWLDTTTVWSSLGTITFPFAMTGRVIIRRVF